ncbi:MAG: hypothetical protein ACYC10_07235 [Allorhizobium sp.]
MKGSLVTSAILHGVALAWALLSLGAPASFEVADVEALPVDIIPIEEMTQIQQGDKNAPVREKAAPVPTKKPTPVDNAENVGDNEIDLKSPPTPEKKPQQTEVAAAPEKVEKVQPTKDTVSNDIKQIIKEETSAAPSTEVAKAEPTPEVKPEPTPQATPEAPPQEAAPEEIPLPENVPVPVAKPKPKPAETKPAETKPADAQAAKAPDRKQDTKTEETAKSKSTKESDFNADEVAALLNKTDAAGGGAKRTTDEAALGGKKTTSGTKLSQSEMDALRGQIQNNWSIIPGMADATDVRIQVKFRLDESGAIIGDPEVTASGGSPSAQQVLMGGARRAVLKSSPFKNLPRDKYDAWEEVIVNFDPSELL